MVKARTASSSHRSTLVNAAVLTTRSGRQVSSAACTDWGDSMAISEWFRAATSCPWVRKAEVTSSPNCPFAPMTATFIRLFFQPALIFGFHRPFDGPPQRFFKGNGLFPPHLFDSGVGKAVTQV